MSEKFNVRARASLWIRFAWVGLVVLQVACSVGDVSRVPQHSAWEVDPVALLSIGATEGDAPFLFQAVAAVRLLPDGRIVVADRGHAVVRVFAEGGDFLTEMGGKGEGPGEFQYINSMSVSGADTLSVYDPAAFRFTQYLPDGTLVGTLQMVGEGGFPEIMLGRLRSGDFALAWIRQERRPLGAVHADVMEIGRFDPSGRLVRRLGEATGMWRWEGPLYPFSPRFYGFTVGDSVYVTDGLEPDLRVLGADGDSLGTVRMHERPEWPSDPWSSLADALAARGNDEALDQLGDVPRELIPATAVVFQDTAGRIWAKEYSPGSDSNWLGFFTYRSGGRWWVLESTGRVLAEVTMPDGLIPFDALGERVVGLTVDSLGVQRVAVHRLHSKDLN